MAWRNFTPPSRTRSENREIKYGYEISLKKWIRAASNFIVPIPSRSVRQMLAIFLELNSETVSRFRKRIRKSLSCAFALHKSWNWALSRRSRAVTAKKCTKKAWCTCKVVVKPIAFLRRQGEFPNMVLRRWIFTTIESALHVSTPYEFWLKLMKSINTRPGSLPPEIFTLTHRDWIKTKVILLVSELSFGTPFAMNSVNSPKEPLKNITITCCFRY